MHFASLKRGSAHDAVIAVHPDCTFGRMSRMIRSFILAFAFLCTGTLVQAQDIPQSADPQQLFEEACSLRVGAGDQKPQPAASLAMMRSAADMGHAAAIATLGEMIWLGEVRKRASLSSPVR